ncbi:MAG: ribose 5-phosphate isomerase B [Bacillota bacterium]|nr:MAG: ribose 5-phosphate isomerase B [Bacillota bacterium]
MRIAIGSDHAGFPLKAELVERLRQDGYEVDDLGTHSTESCDYPDTARPVAEGVSQGRYRLGILICGTGIGMSMAANKVPGVRAALCSETFSARMARAHNDANVLCMGARVIGPGLAYDVARAFLESEFEGGRHQRRVDKLTALERGDA